jgi:hypothetical protein
MHILSVIQTHLSRHFHLTVDFFGLRRGGSWSQIIDQPQEFSEQVSRHRHLSQLERDIPPVTDHFPTDLDELVLYPGQKPLTLYRLLPDLVCSPVCPVQSKRGGWGRFSRALLLKYHPRNFWSQNSGR